jgi:hypothetical protein
MASYIIKNRIKITRQEGDDFDVIFNIDPDYSLVGATVKFGVFRTNPDKPIIQKTGASVNITGQQIRVDIAASETLNKNGLYKWELEVTKGGKIATIGAGDFEIIKTYIE